jgi:hypothetical protein
MVNADFNRLPAQYQPFYRARDPCLPQHLYHTGFDHHVRERIDCWREFRIRPERFQSRTQAFMRYAARTRTDARFMLRLFRRLAHSQNPFTLGQIQPLNIAVK